MKITITSEDIAKAEEAIRAGEQCSCCCPVSQAMNRLYPNDGPWSTTYYRTFTWASSLRKNYKLSDPLREQLQAMDTDRENLSQYFQPGEYELLKP